MKTERTIKFTLDIGDRCALHTVLDIISEIWNKMEIDDNLLINKEQYPRDCVEEVRTFLIDLFQDDDNACEIVKE